ncbi:MAG: hypothetical protein ACPG66_04055 [Flavobacteriales bacterium]
MEILADSAVQKQLIRCQEVLDKARQEGWSEELVVAFDLATRELHEGAVVRKARGLPSPASVAEPHEDVDVVHEGAPINRLLTAEERGEPEETAEAQVDLLSSIGEMTLAEKLALQPLSNVADGMSIVDRAQFTSVLFSGEEEVFSTLLEKLSRSATQEEAFALFREALSPRGEDPEVDALKEEFAKRIVRTFVS